MNGPVLNQRNYVVEQVRRQIRATERRERLQSKLDDLSEEIFSDIVDGWTTGDSLLDFILVSCGGVYGTDVITMMYRRLYDIGLRKTGQEIIVIQKAEYYDKSDFVMLRNIYLARLRADVVVTNIDTLSMSLPVEPGYIIWREFMRKDLIISGSKIFHNEWLITGPLYNEYCEYGSVRKGEDDILFVPEDAVCHIELLPTNDSEALFYNHGIDSEMLADLHRLLIR